jgi:hypothetical protein
MSFLKSYYTQKQEQTNADKLTRDSVQASFIVPHPHPFYF